MRVQVLALAVASAAALTTPFISTRPARVADLAWIVPSVVKESMSPIGTSADNFMMAEVAGKVVGTGQVRPITGGFAASAGSIAMQSYALASVVVSAPSRGQGVGSALVRALVTRYLEAGGSASDLWLLTLSGTVPFYEGFGFRACGDADEAEVPWSLKAERKLGGLVARAAAGSSLALCRGTLACKEACADGIDDAPGAAV